MFGRANSHPILENVLDVLFVAQAIQGKLVPDDLHHLGLDRSREHVGGLASESVLPF